MSIRLAAVIAFVLIGAVCAADTTSTLAWISGRWCAAPGDEHVEELWLPPRRQHAARREPGSSEFRNRRVRVPAHRRERGHPALRCTTGRTATDGLPTDWQRYTMDSFREPGSRFSAAHRISAATATRYMLKSPGPGKTARRRLFPSNTGAAIGEVLHGASFDLGTAGIDPIAGHIFQIAINDGRRRNPAAGRLFNPAICICFF